MAESMTPSELLQQHFEAFQIESEEDGDLKCLANSIALKFDKQCKVSALNKAVAGLSLTEVEKVEPQDIEQHDAMISILIKYIEYAVAMESIEETQGSAEKVFHLSASVALTLGKNYFERLLSRVIDLSTAMHERVRGQACNLMGVLSSHIIEKNEEWVDIRLQNIQQVLASSLTDKSQSVRCSAIQACGCTFHLFELTESDEELVESLLWNLWHDPSMANRIAALQVVPITYETVDHIISRIRDVKEKVRLEALEVMHVRVDPLTQMSPEQFAEVVKSGLSSR